MFTSLISRSECSASYTKQYKKTVEATLEFHYMWFDTFKDCRYMRNKPHMPVLENCQTKEKKNNLKVNLHKQHEVIK